MSAARPRVHALPAGEPVLHFGPEKGPQLVVLQPLFEEMNRCRRLVASLGRALADRGIGCWLPDLPGTGESLRPLEELGWSDWTDAVLLTQRLVVDRTGEGRSSIAFRGGALLDQAFDRRWRFAPVPGASLLTDLRRLGAAGGDLGYQVPDAIANALRTAEPDATRLTRTLRLASDERPADRHVEGQPLWRRPEPADDAALTSLLAQDIAAWLG